MILSEVVNLEQLEELAQQLLSLFQRPCLVLFEGEVGAGKTTLISKIAQNLGESSVSPTYSLVVEGERFVHADFYRLDDPEELTYLEIPLMLQDRPYFFVEWGRDYLQELKEILPEGAFIYQVDIKQIDPRHRRYDLKQL